MSDGYRIYGAELSPYSVKVRSYFRYKGIPHQWLLRNADTAAEFEKYARLPLIPLVVTPADTGLQDSTPIIEAMEEAFPEPAIHPGDPISRFVSALVEEFGDEWGNKWMFHLRWTRDEDRLSAAGRIAALSTGDEESRLAVRAAVIERMSDRLFFVGSNAVTAAQIEQSFRDALATLDAHLAVRPYLFGGRPAFGDFGLWGQIYNAWTDPTGAAWVEGRAPNVLAWVQRMLFPRAEGAFEPWPRLEPTLMPFLAGQVGALFAPWTAANAAALAAGEAEFSVRLAGRPFTQKPQKYHARSLQALRRKYAALLAAPDGAAVDAVLEAAGCRSFLQDLQD